MKFLLDTHTLLWYAVNDPQLSRTATDTIRDSANDIFVSAATYWEIAIKISIGKLAVQQPFAEFIDVCERQYQFRLLPISPPHTIQVSTLPFPPNHRDPFDRLIIAQAMVENMPIISADVAFEAYPVTRVW